MRPISLLPSALLLGISVALSAQTGSPTPDSGVVLKANARAVVVDVVVTKGNDEPVAGLRKEDFAVSEDGKPVTIDFFEEHSGNPLPPEALKPLPPMPTGVYTNVPAVPPTDSVNVILLDTLNSEGQDFSYGRSQVLEFLRAMKPGTRAAIFLLNDKLNFVQGFTDDNSLLVGAINDKRNQVAPNKSAQFYSRSDAADDAEDLARLSAMMSGFAAGKGTVSPTANGNTASGATAGGGGNTGSIASGYGQSAQFQYARRVAMTLEALGYLSRYLSNVPGRKNLLWFAGNFPVNVFPSAQQAQSLNNDRIYESEIRKTADLLTSGNVAVYPISLRGMMVDHWMEGGSAGPGRASGGGGLSRQLREDANDRADTIFAMEELAADTGGHAFYNSNDISAAANRAIHDGAHYYTLVYAPTNTKMDGNFRHIAVKLTRGHYQLRYRRGYNADDPSKLAATGSTGFLSLASTGNKPPEAEIIDDPLSPLFIHGLPSSTQILFGVRVVPVSPQPASYTHHAGRNAKLNGPVTRYSIDFLINAKNAQFDLESPKDGEDKSRASIEHAALQVSMLARDRDGNTVNWAGATQEMHLKPETFVSVQKSGIPVHAEIDLPNTDVYLMTGVYDWGSNKAGTMEIPLHPAAAQSVATAPAAATLPAPKTN